MNTRSNPDNKSDLRYPVELENFSNLPALAASNRAMTSSTVITPTSPSAYVLTASVPSFASCSPTTHITGTFCFSAFLTSFASLSFEVTSTLTPAAFILATVTSTYGVTASVTGNNRTCVGAIHSGNAPA